MSGAVGRSAAPYPNLYRICTNYTQQHTSQKRGGIIPYFVCPWGDSTAEEKSHEGHHDQSGNAGYHSNGHSGTGIDSLLCDHGKFFNSQVEPEGEGETLRYPIDVFIPQPPSGAVQFLSYQTSKVLH